MLLVSLESGNLEKYLPYHYSKLSWLQRKSSQDIHLNGWAHETVAFLFIFPDLFLCCSRTMFSIISSLTPDIFILITTARAVMKCWTSRAVRWQVFCREGVVRFILFFLLKMLLITVHIDFSHWLHPLSDCSIHDLVKACISLSVNPFPLPCLPSTFPILLLRSWEEREVQELILREDYGYVAGSDSKIFALRWILGTGDEVLHVRSSSSWDVELVCCRLRGGKRGGGGHGRCVSGSDAYISGSDSCYSMDGWDAAEGIFSCSRVWVNLQFEQEPVDISGRCHGVGALIGVSRGVCSSADVFGGNRASCTESDIESRKFVDICFYIHLYIARV